MKVKKISSFLISFGHQEVDIVINLKNENKNKN